jgi:hypothetical protein
MCCLSYLLTECKGLNSYYRLLVIKREVKIKRYKMKQLINIMAGTLLSALLLTLPNLAYAQDPIMALDPTLMAGWSGNLAYSKSTSRSAAAKSTFPYTSTPALRQKVVAALAKRLQSQSPKGALAVTSTFGPGKADYGAFYSQMLKTSALHDNDAADALTGLILVAYQIVNNVPDEQVTAVIERAARAQIAGIAASNSKIKSMTTRAQVAEELKLQTVVLALGLRESVAAKTEAAYRKSIQTMFQSQYHIDLHQVKLTNRGFVKR